MTAEDRERGCVFCDIVAGEEAASVVFEDDRVLAFMNRAQFNAGHVLVIPMPNRADARELEPMLGAAIMNAVSEVARAVTRAFQPDGLTVQHNIGAAGGQDVFHAHVHIYTRHPGDGLHRTYPQAPPRPPRAELDALAERIRTELPSEDRENQP